jgi:peptidoglycan/LPS O-acetylase OafA/YrhL
MNPNKIHFGWLDSVRGFAVLFVLAYHCLFWPFQSTHISWKGNCRDFGQSLDFLILTPITFGWAGVAVFFVVSGFCIHLSFLRHPNFKNFFWKRFWRICPPYFVCLILFFVGDLATGQLVGTSNATFQFFSHFFFVHNLWKETHFGINPSFWSIAVEAQLYLIYPILLVFQKRLGWARALSAALILELVCNTSFYGSREYLYSIPTRLFSNGPFAYWFSWSLGAYLAQSTLTSRKNFWPRIAHPIPILILVLAAWLYQPLTSLSFLFVSLLTASLMARRLSIDLRLQQQGTAGNSREQPAGWVLLD